MHYIYVLLVVFSWVGCSSESFQKSSVDIVEMSNDKKIFIRSSAWGISGGNGRIIVEYDTLDKGYNPERDYAFMCEKIFYVAHNDTLLLYVPYSSVMPYPENWESSIVVICSRLHHPEWMDYVDNYARYGMKMASPYTD